MAWIYILLTLISMHAHANEEKQPAPPLEKTSGTLVSTQTCKDKPIVSNMGLDQSFMLHFSQDLYFFFGLEIGNWDDTEKIEALTEKFWQIFFSEETQRFFSLVSGKPTEGNLEFLAQDLLLWLSFGHSKIWQGNAPIMPSIQEIDVNALKWKDWIRHSAHPQNNMHGLMVITAIQSANHGESRTIDFGQDKNNMAFYGYSTDLYPDGKITNDACIQHLTLHHTEVNLVNTMQILTDSNREDGNGYRNRVSAHFVIAPSGIIYNIVDTQYPAWHAGYGHFYEYESISIDPSGIVSLLQPHRIPGSYNNYSIGIEVVNELENHTIFKEFTPNQEESVVKLCDLLISSKLYRGRPQHRSPQLSYIVSHGEVDPLRKRDINYSFPWEKLGNKTLVGQLKGSTAISCGTHDKALFVYSKERPQSDPSIVNLRYSLRATGIPVAITGDQQVDSIYDEALARCCWQFKAKYMGRSCPELCSVDTSVTYLREGADMNLDWTVAAKQMLETVLLHKYSANQ